MRHKHSKQRRARRARGSQKFKNEPNTRMLFRRDSESEDVLEVRRLHDRTNAYRYVLLHGAVVLAWVRLEEDARLFMQAISLRDELREFLSKHP